MLDYRCTVDACPVGIVTIRPKDDGLGSDTGEIEDAMNGDGLSCPLCGEDLEK